MRAHRHGRPPARWGPAEPLREFPPPPVHLAPSPAVDCSRRKPQRTPLSQAQVTALWLEPPYQRPPADGDTSFTRRVAGFRRPALTVHRTSRSRGRQSLSGHRCVRSVVRSAGRRSGVESRVARSAICVDRACVSRVAISVRYRGGLCADSSDFGALFGAQLRNLLALLGHLPGGPCDFGSLPGDLGPELSSIRLGLAGRDTGRPCSVACRTAFLMACASAAVKSAAVNERAPACGSGMGQGPSYGRPEARTTTHCRSRERPPRFEAAQEPPLLSVMRTGIPHGSSGRAATLGSLSAAPTCLRVCRASHPQGVLVRSASEHVCSRLYDLTQ